MEGKSRSTVDREWSKFMKKEVKSFAKINLHLAVGPKREDGFHNLQSIFAKISLFDLIKIEAKESKTLKINIEGLDNCELIGEDTITKAIKLWCEYTKHNLEVNVNIEKNIPIKAGLGGGSSNAAYTLKTLNEMFCNYALSEKTLFKIGLMIGSDVPFFLHDATFAYVEGQGEIITKLDAKFDYEIQLYKPQIGVSTKGAFDKLDNIKRQPFINKQTLINAFYKGVESWKNSFFNDFELVINSEILKSLNILDDEFVHLSGSGSTCFIVCNNFPKCYNKFTLNQQIKNNIYYKSCFFSNI